MKETFTRDEVIAIIEEIAQRPDMFLQQIQGENTEYSNDGAECFVRMFE